MKQYQTTRRLTPDELRAIMDQPGHYADLRNGGMMEPAYQRRACAAVFAATLAAIVIGWAIIAAMNAVWGA